MKTTFIFLITLIIVSNSFAQNGINYKAIIKDSNGNAVANQNITIQFRILQNTLVVYSEMHSPTTDDNAIVIVNIGEGTPVSGSPYFSSIGWASDQHFLNVRIDTGSGLIDMGTTEFKTVPYALNAANVSGLEAINEGNGIGHRIIGKNPATAGPIGNNAVDLSQSPISSETYGATGSNSIALNRQTTAQGQNATAMGLDSKAYGNTSTSMGFNSIANGYDSVAMGAYTIADAVQSVAIGRYNIGGGHNQIWNPVEPLFEIGNGANNNNRSNALTILKNGTITAPSLTNALIDEAGDKALITKEYANVLSSGLEALNEGNGIGWRLKNRNPGLHGGIGLNSIDLSYSGFTSSTNGASGSNSFAIGVNTSATGFYSSVSGFFTNANSFVSTAMGRYNVGGGSPSSWVSTDPIFEIGNGTSTAARSNAFTVLKNGRVGIGTSTPETNLHIIGAMSLDGILMLPQGGSRIKIDSNWVPFTTDDFYTSGDQDHQWYSVYSLTGFANASDASYKKNISDMTYGLEEVMQLKPVSYQWKNVPNKRDKLGFLAQDLLKVLPEVVLDYELEKNKKEGSSEPTFKQTDKMSVYYSDIIPVLTKAIQEQQIIIEDQQKQIDELKALVLNKLKN